MKLRIIATFGKNLTHNFEYWMIYEKQMSARHNRAVIRKHIGKLPLAKPKASISMSQSPMEIENDERRAVSQ